MSERLPVSVSSAVFIENDQGQILLIRQAAIHKGEKWGPPAGGMWPNETPLQTALRETEEEIGVRPVLTALLGIYTDFRGDKASGLAFVFRGRLTDGSLMNVPNAEISEARFFSPAEIENLIKANQIYKPEYNIRNFKDWLAGNSFPLEAVCR